MVKSETVDYAFTVKEDGRGHPFIMCEPRYGELSILGKNAFLSLSIETVISIEKAQDIANYLNDNIDGVSVMRTSSNWMQYGGAWLAWRFQKMLTRLRQLWLTQ